MLTKKVVSYRLEYFYTIYTKNDRTHTQGALRYMMAY